MFGYLSRFYFSTYSLVFVSIEKIDRNSVSFDFQPRISSKIFRRTAPLDVWKSSETRDLSCLIYMYYAPTSFPGSLFFPPKAIFWREEERPWERGWLCAWANSEWDVVELTVAHNKRGRGRSLIEGIQEYLFWRPIIASGIRIKVWWQTELKCHIERSLY